MKNLLKRYQKIVFTLLFFELLIVILAFVKVPYDIVSPAFVNEVDKVILVDSDYEEKGSFNTVSVYSVEKVSLLTYLFALCDKKTTISRTYPVYNLSNTLAYQAGTIQKEVSIINALISAYELAKFYGYPVEIKYHYAGFIIDTYYSYMTKNTLKIGDIITKIGDYSLLDGKYSVSEALQKADQDSPHGVVFLVTRGSDELSFTLTKNEYIDYYGINRSGYGVSGYDYYVIDETVPTYQINETTTIGPSGGLLQALSIFNALTTDLDYTGGYKIVGTGTIDINGQAGAIGGIYQKIITANLEKADIFFVPVNRFLGYSYEYIKISSNNTWKIGNYDTGIIATKDSIPYIFTDGFWYINDVTTKVRALGDIRVINDEDNLDNESNFLEAYRSYHNLKNSKMDFVPISSLEEAVSYLLVKLDKIEELKRYRTAYQYAKMDDNNLTVDNWFASIKEEA